jgi:hypothetical protein
VKRSTRQLGQIALKIPTSLKGSNDVPFFSFATTFDHFFGVLLLLIFPWSIQ